MAALGSAEACAAAASRRKSVDADEAAEGPELAGDLRYDREDEERGQRQRDHAEERVAGEEAGQIVPGRDRADEDGEAHERRPEQPAAAAPAGGEAGRRLHRRALGRGLVRRRRGVGGRGGRGAELVGGDHEGIVGGAAHAGSAVLSRRRALLGARQITPLLRGFVRRQIRARLPAPGQARFRARQAGAPGLRASGSAAPLSASALTRSGRRTRARQCLAKGGFEGRQPWRGASCDCVTGGLRSGTPPRGRGGCAAGRRRSTA